MSDLGISSSPPQGNHVFIATLSCLSLFTIQLCHLRPTLMQIYNPLDVLAVGPYLSPLALYLRKHAVFLSPFVFFIPFVNFKTIIMADLTKNKPELCVSIKGTTIVLKRIMLPAPQSFKSPDTSLRTSTEVLSFFISPLTFKY